MNSPVTIPATRMISGVQLILFFGSVYISSSSMIMLQGSLQSAQTIRSGFTYASQQFDDLYVISLFCVPLVNVGTLICYQLVYTVSTNICG
jgi:hypothetical protein